MYNEERKMRFLKENRNSLDYGVSIFKRMEAYEKEADKDLCELTGDILQTAVNSTFGTRSVSVKGAILFLRSYVRWCKECEFPTCDDIFSLEADMEEKFKQRMIASPMHLELTLNKAFEPVGSETVDCVYRCYLWMAFAGVERAETVNITVDEIDFGSMTIEHKSKSYEIYREAIPAFKMACEATQFKYVHPNYDNTIYRKRYEGNYLFRGIRSSQIAIDTIKSVVNAKFIKAGIKTSYEKIRMSGVFYKIYEMERLGMPPNLDDIAMEQVLASRGEHKDDLSSVRNTAKSAARSLKADYECWKAVFT